ncbi:hypothetical protein PR048_007428 [Dryococelus australis]|uniref:Uncharacterized protein n=1 Tax=Dryococelus australis TaxID=614101 RepID=A0ABQ9HU97_9NEOP|nr:hypothetical protein PR048_007428 [Dryococelus australis]
MDRTLKRTHEGLIPSVVALGLRKVRNDRERSPVLARGWVQAGRECMSLGRKLQHARRMWLTSTRRDCCPARAPQLTCDSCTRRRSLVHVPWLLPILIAPVVYLEAANRRAAEKRSSWKLLMKTVHFEGETTAIGTREVVLPASRVAAAYVFKLATMVGGNPEYPMITSLGIQFGIAAPNLSSTFKTKLHHSITEGLKNMLRYDKLDLKRTRISVTFSIGPQFIRHALLISEPVADLQGKNKHWIPCHLIMMLDVFRRTVIHTAVAVLQLQYECLRRDNSYVKCGNDTSSQWRYDNSRVHCTSAHPTHALAGPSNQQQSSSTLAASFRLAERVTRLCYIPQSSTYWSFSCVFIGRCPTPGSYGIREVFLCKSAIGSEAASMGLINCDPIANESCRTMPPVSGFSGGSPVCPPPPCILALPHTHFASSSSALKTPLLRASQISSLTHSTDHESYSELQCFGIQLSFQYFRKEQMSAEDKDVSVYALLISAAPSCAVAGLAG